MKFERILETYLSYAPKGISSFLKAMPLWIKKKLWINRVNTNFLEFRGLLDFEKKDDLQKDPMLIIECFKISPYPQIISLSFKLFKKLMSLITNFG